MKNKTFDIVGNRNKFFIFSAVVIALIILFSIIFGVKMDIQFKGGALINYGCASELDETLLSKTVTGVLGSSASVQQGSNSASGNNFTVTMPGTATVTAEQLEALGTALDEAFPNDNIQQLEVNNVNPTIGKEFFAKSIVGVLAAFVLILIYIAIRFRKIGGLPAGCMAIVALMHDLIVVFGVFVIMRTPLNGNFIAAVLTILGYSINDTVVIYDRIRENRSLYGNKVPFAELVNTSINQSLKRSISTTVSTIIALGAVCVISVIYGLDSIFTFAFPLIIGMISGVYSTVCIAGPLWVAWETRKGKTAKGKGKTKAKSK